jgi:hypothetical protein
MARYDFSDAERWGIFMTHNRKCYMCGDILTMRSMQIDHVLPESLLKDPTKLDEAIAWYGKPSSFKINSFENWLPSCYPCNNKKRRRMYRRVPAVLGYLQDAENGANRAAEIAAEVLKDRELGAAIHSLRRGRSSGAIPKKTTAILAEHFVSLHPELFIRMDSLLRQGIELSNPDPPTELRLSTNDLVQFKPEGELILVSTGERTGVMPRAFLEGKTPHISWQCPTCGSYGPWNGVMCLTCGRMSDPDC